MWGASGFVPFGSSLIFGSAMSNNMVTFTNPIAFVHCSLASGQLDLYPDDAGSLLLLLDATDTPAATDASNAAPLISRRSWRSEAKRSAGRSGSRRRCGLSPGSRSPTRFATGRALA